MAGAVPLKILHVIAEMVPGGAERIVLQLAADARAHGDQVDVATAGGAWEDRLAETGATIHHLPTKERGAVGTATAAWTLAGVIRRVRPDLVHTHNVRVTAAARAGRLLAGSRAPMVTTLHGLTPADYPGAARILRYAAQTVVACAPAVRRAVVAAGLPASRVRTITNGAALEPASEERVEAATARLGIIRPAVIGVGRLVAQKSWSTLVEAACDSGLDGVDIVVIGEGEQRAELEARTAAAGGRVRFVGAVDDVAAALGLAGCLVNSSSWEGLPLSLLEALSLGVPAVATAVDGVVDVVPPDAALLVPPGDPPALAAAIRRVLFEEGLATRLSANARDAAKTWSPEAMLAAYRSLYDDLVSERASR